MSSAPIVVGPLPVQRFNAVVTGGTAVASINTTAPAFLDRVARVRFTVALSQLVAGHLAAAADLLAECVVVNKNGVVTFLGAIPTSINPIDSNTAAFLLTSRPLARDASLNLSTAILTIDVGGNLLCTVTNAAVGGGVTVDVTVLPYVEIRGSVP